MWLRAPAVLVAPRAVFVALRDEAEDEVDRRQEALTGLIGLAGIAAVLSKETAGILPVWQRAS